MLYVLNNILDIINNKPKLV